MHELTEQALLARLAERAGIATDYYDIAGTLHFTSDDTKRAILTAMGFAIDTTASLIQTLQEWDDAPWQRPCDPVRILRDGEAGGPLSCYLLLEDGKEGSLTVEWQIRDEANAVVQEGRAGPGLTAAEVRFIKEQRHVRVEIPAPHGLSLGYYTVTIRAESLVGERRRIDAAHRRTPPMLHPASARSKPTAMGIGLAALFIALRSQLGMRRLHRSRTDCRVGRERARRRSDRTQSITRTAEYRALSH